jgi:N-acetylmuramoyl-L-alanine amidase CwlA
MKRVIIHWTAGSYNINNAVLNSYHYAVDDKGGVIPCNHRPEDNENCQDGNYAAHTGGGNTGSIGVSMCGMYGFDLKNKKTKYPLTKKQCEATFKLVAELCKKYNIAISPQTVMTHYEFGQQNKKTSSYGKIDITYLPSYPDIKPQDCGTFIRQKVKWYYMH